MQHQPVIVLGAGSIGLSTAQHLGEGALVIDQTARFRGWNDLIEKSGFQDYLRGKLSVRTFVTAVAPDAHSLTLADGSEMNYDYLVNTIDIPTFLGLLPPLHTLIQQDEVRLTSDKLALLRTALIKYQIVLADTSEISEPVSFEKEVEVGRATATFIQQLQAEQSVVS